MTADPASVSRSMKLRSTVNAEEWQTRVDLAACYRLIAYYDITDLTFTHISARVPGEDGNFLLNPFHKILDDTPYTYNPAGYTIHSAVLAARPDVSCVLHTHSTAGMAVASMECGLLPLTQTSLRFHNALAYHDYEGAALDLDERPRLARDLGTQYAMILRNHGLLTVGRTVAEAFVIMHRLESACRAQVQAQAAGVKLIELSENVRNHAAGQFQATMKTPFGDREWPSLLRMMDRLDPTYKM
jgi:ribulose-5-phosphate 4-epimerase/fuculose-1-phosphate aldolase